MTSSRHLRVRAFALAAFALSVLATAVPVTLCAFWVAGLRGDIGRINDAAAHARLAREAVDKVGQSLVGFAATALDLSAEERAEHLATTDARFEEFGASVSALRRSAPSLLPPGQLDGLAGAVDAVVHSWEEIREQTLAGINPVEKTYHFLRIFDASLAARAALLAAEVAAGAAAEVATEAAFGRIEQTGRALVGVMLVGGLLGLGVSFGLYHHALATRTANAELAAKNEELGSANEELARRDEELSMRNARFDAALSNMSQGLCMFDAGGRLVVANRRFAAMFGLAAAEPPPGSGFAEILGLAVAAGGLTGGDADLVRDRTLRSAAARELAAFQWELGDGRVLAVDQRPIGDRGWVATYEDVTERRRAEARVAHMACHDALTDLPNRVLLRERLGQALALAQARREGEPVAVLCLDLDRFKQVNDTLGHPVGDALLCAVAERLRACVREEDTAARLGGDEFAVVQVGVGQPEGAGALARRLVEALSESYEVAGHQLVVGASVGIALAPGDGDDADDLLKKADVALYRAKAEGRGTYRSFEPGMDAKLQARRLLELDLRRALAVGEFELHYQPLVGLRTGTIAGFEALLRWRHPERGMVPPSDFVPLAEEIGLIVLLGEWVLQRACADAAGWPDPVRVAVNLSAVQFRGDALVPAVVGALVASGLAPGRLELEITEGALLHDGEATLAILRELRSLGIRIAMDDFGTGYSSLGYLRSFPFDKIKIDRSFVAELGTRPDCEAIVRAVTGLGGSLGITTTAEGVETAAQLERLRAEGCDEVQGYGLGRPLPAAEAARLLEAARGDAILPDHPAAGARAVA